jgi:type II secretion system protein G
MRVLQIFKKMKIINKTRGFTLIELLVAISIIATLTAIVLPNFMGARERAKDTQKKEDMAALKNALRMVYNDTQSYPAVEDMVSVVTDYMPNVDQLDDNYTYTYTPINNNDGFQLCVEMESMGQLPDNVDSQYRCRYLNGVNYEVCGVPVDTNAQLFVICAN